MQISDLQIHIIQLGRDYHLPLHGDFRAEAGVVRILTDAGVEGNADYCTWAVPPRVLGEQILSLKPHLIGEDPLDIERLWTTTFQPTRTALSIYGPGCINVALWDIMGKALNQPIHRLLGGAYRTKIPVYASSMRRDISPEDEARRMYELRDKHGCATADKILNRRARGLVI